MKKIDVVAAIIQNNNQTLCVQRGWSKYEYIANKYEFPGGKIEQGETKQQALERELREELDLVVEVNDLFYSIIHYYPDFEVSLHSFIVEVDSRNIKLNEHISEQWLNKEDLLSLDWAAADYPIVEKLMEE